MLPARRAHKPGGDITLPVAPTKAKYAVREKTARSGGINIGKWAALAVASGIP